MRIPFEALLKFNVRLTEIQCHSCYAILVSLEMTTLHYCFYLAHGFDHFHLVASSCNRGQIKFCMVVHGNARRFCCRDPLTSYRGPSHQRSRRKEHTAAFNLAAMKLLPQGRGLQCNNVRFANKHCMTWPKN